MTPVHALCNFWASVGTLRLFDATSLRIAPRTSWSWPAFAIWWALSSSMVSHSANSFNGASLTGIAYGFKPGNTSIGDNHDALLPSRFFPKGFRGAWLIIACSHSVMCGHLSGSKLHSDNKALIVRSTSFHSSSTVPLAHGQMLLSNDVGHAPLRWGLWMILQWSVVLIGNKPLHRSQR